jgi:UDP-N-acetylmuramate--alanine ligase
MIDFNKINNVYLVGIGGIGMSALARYFMTLNKFVAGYDKTSTPLTDQLISEGIPVHFNDDLALVPDKIIKQKENTLIIYTPAVPNYHYEFNYFIERGYNVMKRSEVLGFIFSNKKGIAVAGTHGKTTTSTMIAHLLKQSSLDCSAFLGGISKNYGTNLLVSSKNEFIVTEADEYDRSFLQLFPYIAVITSVDADHLDIYGTHEEVIRSFNQFASQIIDNGILIYKKGINLSLEELNDVTVFSYSYNEYADFFAMNISIDKGYYTYDVQTPLGILKDITLGVAGKMNIENSVAAIAVATILEVNPEEIRSAMATFTGVKRRFEYHIRRDDFVYIDDYAHHPEELKACIQSAREIFPAKQITGIFQPHLYTRTRDFEAGFIEALGLLDELILLDIYPAREEPIPGVTSEMIFKKVKLKNKILCSKEELLTVLEKKKPEVLITMGAGDIDSFVEPIKKMFG